MSAHVQELISQLYRLFVPAAAIAPEALAQQIRGEATAASRLADERGQVRTIVIPFESTGEAGQHWTLLCKMANALQEELGLPAPAVSITGATGFRLWLSLETPVPAARAQEFATLLCAAYVPEMATVIDAASEPLELPPCLNRATGKWAAFIHPGMGASFAEEAGLEMAPPVAGQVGFLEGLQSIGATQFDQALDALGASRRMAAPVPASQNVRPDWDQLLLRDATLEDIVKWLHSRNIEPTFRHLLP